MDCQWLPSSRYSLWFLSKFVNVHLFKYSISFIYYVIRVKRGSSPLAVCSLQDPTKDRDILEQTVSPKKKTLPSRTRSTHLINTTLFL